VEYILGVLLDLGRVTVTPGGMDGITVDETAIREAGLAIEPCLFPQFTLGCLEGRLASIETAGDGLPEAFRLPAQELQYLAVVGMDDDQD
jgi:hypothetical protein